METLTHIWSKELVECIHFLHQKGYAPATSSNYSYRIPGDVRLHISASGIDKGQFAESHLMQVDLQGEPIEDARRPSAETLLHTLIYRRLPEAACVLHTHTIYNTVLSTLFEKEGQLILEGFEVLKGLSGIKTHQSSVAVPIFANSQDMPALSEEIQTYWEQHPDLRGFLLAGHGFYTWGSSIAEAKRQIEVFEFLFECFYKIELFQASRSTKGTGLA